MISITIIDDEVQITTMLQKALSKNREFTVSVFNNPVEALRQLNTLKPDAVLEEIKKNRPETRVIMMTAYSTLESVLSSRRGLCPEAVREPERSRTESGQVVQDRIVAGRGENRTFPLTCASCYCYK